MSPNVRTDPGVWTLQCGSCFKPFLLELGVNDYLWRFLKEYRCPSCQAIPSHPHWHNIVDFRVSHVIP